MSGTQVLEVVDGNHTHSTGSTSTVMGQACGCCDFSTDLMELTPDCRDPFMVSPLQGNHLSCGRNRAGCFVS